MKMINVITKKTDFFLKELDIFYLSDMQIFRRLTIMRTETNVRQKALLVRSGKAFFGRNLGELKQLEVNKNFDPQILLLFFKVVFKTVCAKIYARAHTHT